jgi:Dehydratase large subunit
MTTEQPVGSDMRRTSRTLPIVLAGDYLQTSAIFDQQLRVLSLVTDPNDYAGPGTGFEPGPERQAEINAPAWAGHPRRADRTGGLAGRPRSAPVRRAGRRGRRGGRLPWPVRVTAGWPPGAQGDH